MRFKDQWEKTTPLTFFNSHYQLSARSGLEKAVKSRPAGVLSTANFIFCDMQQQARSLTPKINYPFLYGRYFVEWSTTMFEQDGLIPKLSPQSLHKEEIFQKLITSHQDNF